MITVNKKRTADFHISTGREDNEDEKPIKKMKYVCLFIIFIM